MTNKRVATAETTQATGIELPPVASMLMESLRSVGYTTATALADIIDNSIAANARTIRVSLTPAPIPYIAIVDDGTGMDESSLVSAMRFGSRDPRDVRHGMDLGRFGLGLKTASLSQCRCLTVVTMKDGHLSIARWDLDACERRGTWWLERPHASELPREPLALLEVQGQGTAVLWEDLDRMTAAGGEKAVLDAADHLALAFHRYLAGEIVGPFSLLLNERPLPTIDPFLEGHTRGQSLHVETISIDGHLIRISPFVLPFPSKLKPADLERVGGRESVSTAHGFYIYRSGRLVVPGGWFRIVPADELIRLARIRVDIPVELDHLWRVDIRKAVAEPPPALRPHLKRIVGDVTLRSRKVYKHKGVPASDSERVPFWRRHDLRDQGAAWKVNRDHPFVRSFLTAVAELPHAQALLRLLEDNLPIQDIHIHTSNDQPVAEAAVLDESELEALALRMVIAFENEPDIASRLLDKLAMTEPFNRDPAAAKRIAERLRP
jgi:Histidine kinase-, DNA gyrase B-, and HSP90-like ATPase